MGCFKLLSCVLFMKQNLVLNGHSLQIAVLAKHHGVPFYVAAPLTSIDLETPNGERIVIEERPAVEMTHIGGQPIAASGKIQFFL